MTSDPASRRARNVVLLVIVTVALPSLVLTALGVAAIRNEEVATKRRVERLYRPVLGEVADNFNLRFDQLMEEAEPALVALLSWSHHPKRNMDGFRAFVEENPAATNFFVLDDEGREIAPAFSQTERPGCCVCFKADEAYAPSGRRGRTSCSDRRLETQIEQLLSPTCASAAGVDVDTLAELHMLLGQSPPTDPEEEARYIKTAAHLAGRLGDPTRGIDPRWAQNIAQVMMYRFEALSPEARRWAGGIIALQSQREPLLESLTQVARTKSNQLVIAGLQVAKLRRLVVLLHVNDRTAGFELVPTPLEHSMNRVLVERELDDRLVARVGPLITPMWWTAFISPAALKLTKAQIEQRMVTWVLCSRSNVNWAFELQLVEPGLLADLGRSRSGLYLWSLILVGIALVTGIAYTVRSVIQEARLSRLKTDFVSSVSHDLRTPLTSIRMFSETLRAGRYESEAERHEFLQIIIDEAERLSRLTERILDFSRMEAGRKSYRKKPTDIAGLIEHALVATRPMIDAADFTVEVETQHDLPPIPVDRDAMLEVLINLFTNAIKYSPDGRWMGVLITGSVDEVRISVRDHGIGIRKADQRRIFEKFFRVDTRRAAEVSGSGIGLSLVKHIVDMHGGSVEVESTPGAGSTFTVRLPIDANATVNSPAKSAGDNRWTASWS